ncbi:uncharacterized protein LOC111373610 [Olea europaea var. sylvestris]|uniref:uncharacterized protein LOC111373610 n=1 Tax=Olea europaea var. sylvestris TaxID=158386 RepID=UPI000C1D08E6|nr:uncharacterized protein LOC111373610 [Olea europaea var. sylvestris]
MEEQPGSPVNMEKRKWDHTPIYYVKEVIRKSIIAMFISVIVWIIMKVLLRVFEHSSNQHVDLIDIVLALFLSFCLIILTIFQIFSIFLTTCEAIKGRTSSSILATSIKQ